MLQHSLSVLSFSSKYSVLRSDDLYAQKTVDQPERVKPEALAHNSRIELPPLSRMTIAIE